VAGASYGGRVARLRWSHFDPFRLSWRLLTSVRFALGLIGFLALVAFLGVVIPQVPSEMRGNAAAEVAWYALQEDRFGVFYPAMHALDVFTIFRTPYFIAGLALLVMSVCVCTANRLPAVWRNVFEPQTRVPEEYLRGDATIGFEATNPGDIEAELRRRRFRVTASTEGDATYVFADRYPWAQFATFVSHLALILFLAGGFVTVITAREQQVLVAEGETPLPVFPIDDPDHMQIAVEDAIGEFDATGFPLDFRTYLVVYRNGEEVARGVTTVNDPLSYNGYKFHQSVFFPDGAALQVRDVASGRLLYDEVLALVAQATTPRIVVRDASGAIVLDDVIVPTDFFGDTAGTLVSLPGGRQFWVGARPSDTNTGWQLIVYETTRTDSYAVLTEGQRQDFDGLNISFVGMTSVPSMAVSGVPGLDGQGVAELSQGPSGPLLTVGTIGGRALALSPGEPVTVDGRSYTFLGTREFAGITVRRDPGSTFIWVATGLFLLGLALTFYTPRRRLWGKITAGQASFRGLGGQRSSVEKEIREVAAKASRRAELPDKSGSIS
jgi:cytochrome c biogenesis protein